LRHLVIIPTYNEVENISRIVPEVLKLSENTSILIVDDNSTDGTLDSIKVLQDINPNRVFLIRRAGKLGLGTAYIEGFKYSLKTEASFIYEMDADFSHAPSDLQKLMEILEFDQADVVVGSRYVAGGKLVNWPFQRKLISISGSIYTRLITWMPIKDPTAGFIGYKREVLAAIDLNKISFVGYAFQIQMKFESWIRGFRIKEIPITFKDREAGTSKMSSNIVKEAALGVLIMKWRSMFS